VTIIWLCATLRLVRSVSSNQTSILPTQPHVDEWCGDRQDAGQAGTVHQAVRRVVGLAEVERVGVDQLG
jgi:hypothetical protein